MKIVIEYDKSINIRRDEELKVRKRKGEQWINKGIIKNIMKNNLD